MSIFPAVRCSRRILSMCTNCGCLVYSPSVTCTVTSNGATQPPDVALVPRQLRVARRTFSVKLACHRAKGEQERHYKSLDGGHGTQDECSSFEKVQSPTFYVLCLSP